MSCHALLTEAADGMAGRQQYVRGPATADKIGHGSQQHLWAAVEATTAECAVAINLRGGVRCDGARL